MSQTTESTKPAPPPAAGSKYFDVVAMAFVSVYLISQVSSSKLFVLGSLQLPGAAVVFPLSYIFGDILTEVYGYARTRRVIWASFCAAILMALVLWIVQILPPAPGWTNQQAYQSILGVVPRLVLGSIVAYWAGEFTNSYIMAKMKLLTKGRHLWTRTVGSTVVGQAVDTIVFTSVAFAGRLPWDNVLRITATMYMFKVAYEIAATPLTYAIVTWLKRVEQVDVYDWTTNFTPFQL
jgi:queuosine precursor transporter